MTAERRAPTVATLRGQLENLARQRENAVCDFSDHLLRVHPIYSMRHVVGAVRALEGEKFLDEDHPLLHGAAVHNGLAEIFWEHTIRKGVQKEGKCHRFSTEEKAALREFFRKAAQYYLFTTADVHDPSEKKRKKKTEYAHVKTTLDLVGTENFYGIMRSAIELHGKLRDEIRAQDIPQFRKKTVLAGIDTFHNAIQHVMENRKYQREVQRALEATEKRDAAFGDGG